MVNRIKCDYCGRTSDGNVDLVCRGCGAGFPIFYPLNYNEYKGINPSFGVVHSLGSTMFSAESLMYSTGR